MPEMKHFVVTQTREVEVTANSISDAVQIASAAFEHGQNSDRGVARGHSPEGTWGNTSSRIQIIDIRAHDLRPRKVNDG